MWGRQHHRTPTADRSSVFVFEDAGEHELKGIPDRWRLYGVVS
jgi:hypothetical protein